MTTQTSPQLKSNERRTLDALAAAAQPLSKGELARTVFGEVTGSTQAMVTRITQTLAGHGYIEERLDGRYRQVAITEAGRRALPKLPVQPARVTWESLVDLQIDDPATGLRPVRYSPPEARNIKHLHGAAVLVAYHLAHQGEWSAANEQFAQAMLVLIDEKPDVHEEASRDLVTMRSLAASWPRNDLWRAALVELLALVENPDERNNNAPALAKELVRLAGDCASSPQTALLWSAGAGSILGPLRTREEQVSELRPKLVEALRTSLRAAQPVSRGMAKYWRARSLVGLGALTAASFDWPRFDDRLDTNQNDEVGKKARKVTEDVLASGEVNIRLLKLERIENGTVLPCVERMHGRTLPPSALDAIEVIFEDVAAWSEIWSKERSRLCTEVDALRTATQELYELPQRLNEATPLEVSALPVAWKHIFRCGGEPPDKPARIADGDLKDQLRGYVRDNLWTTSMVLGYVSAMHRHELIYENVLS